MQDGYMKSPSKLYASSCDLDLAIAFELDKIYHLTDRLYRSIDSWKTGLGLVSNLIEAYQNLLKYMRIADGQEPDPIFLQNIENLQFLQVNILASLCIECNSEFSFFHSELKKIQCSAHLEKYLTGLATLVEFYHSKNEYVKYQKCYHTLLSQITDNNLSKIRDLFEVLGEQIEDHLEEYEYDPDSPARLKYKSTLKLAFQGLSDATNQMLSQLECRSRNPTIRIIPIDVYHSFFSFPPLLLSSSQELARFIQILDLEQHWFEFLEFYS